jgi:hypothetical protein
MAHPICFFLQEKIKAFVGKKNESVRWLAKQVGVDYTIVYRLQAGEQKSLSFFDAKRILKVIEPDRYLEILGEFYPAEVQEMADSKLTEQQTDELLDIIAFALTDIDRYRIFAFATETMGATRSLVIEEFGKFGREILDALISKKALRIMENGTIENLIAGRQWWSDELVKKVALNNIHLMTSASPGTHMRNWVTGLNERGLRAYYDAHANFIESLANIENSQEFKGSIVTASSLFVGPILDKKVEA